MFGRAPVVENNFECEALSFFDRNPRRSLTYTIPLPVRVNPKVQGRDQILGKKQLPSMFVWHLEVWPEVARDNMDNDSADST
jgi:hypothetical protein